jgi:arylsulfatase A-like enzyme
MGNYWPPLAAQQGREEGSMKTKPQSTQWFRKIVIGDSLMSAFRNVFVSVFLCLSSVAAHAEGWILNGADWRDTNGNHISCHESGMSRFGDTFYWYGTSYIGNPKGICSKRQQEQGLQRGLNVYSSRDLANWTYEGVALDFNLPGNEIKGSGHRPSVIYNAKTKQYVMWFFDFTKYPAPMMAVAVSDSPAGPFRIHARDILTGEEHGYAQDCGVFQDDDGKAYLVYDDGHRNLRVDLLSDDYLSSTRKTVIAIAASGVEDAAHPTPGLDAYEGSAMIKCKGKYIVAGSGVCGWGISPTTYAVASSPLGPYSEPKVMSDKDTWGSQISNFIYIRETDTVMALCDQWWSGQNPRSDLEASRYLWLPIMFDPETGNAKMEYSEKWNPLLSGKGGTGGLAGKRPPNIIFVLADDLSYWDISHFGQKHFCTPNIDRMAREGRVFSNAYAGGAWCAPSRATLLTGRDGRNLSPLETDETGHGTKFKPTVAHMLKTAGYATCALGKWHMEEGRDHSWLTQKTWEEQKAATNWAQMPWNRGFDLCRIGYRCGFQGSNGNPFYPWQVETGDNREIVWSENQNVDRARLWKYDPAFYDKEGRFTDDAGNNSSKMRYSEDYYREEAASFMQKNKDKPFFLYYATPLVHGPLVVKQLDTFENSENWTFEHRLWATMVQELDRSVGFLLDEVKQLGLEQNTIILFAADNGYSQWGYFRNHNRKPWSNDPIFQNKGPWNRGKFVNTNGGVIVPFIAWGPGRVAAGETGRAVNFYDFMGTAAELAGAKLPYPTDGVSFVPLLEGREQDQPVRPVMVWPENVSRRGIDRNDWVEDDHRGAPRSNAVLLDERFFALQIREKWVVFDITIDPGMKHALSEQRPELCERAQVEFANITPKKK